MTKIQNSKQEGFVHWNIEIYLGFGICYLGFERYALLYAVFN